MRGNQQPRPRTAIRRTGTIAVPVGMMALALWLLYSSGVFTLIFDRVDAPTHNAIGMQGDWLRAETHGGITVEHINDAWNHGKVVLQLTVGSCRQIGGYAVSQPNNQQQPITLYLIIPGGDRQHFYQPPEADLPLNDARSIGHAVQALLADANLKKCVVGDPRLRQFGA